MRTIQLITSAVLAFALIGCNYHLRGTQESSIVPGDHLIKTQSSDPKLSYLLSVALRESGYKIAAAEYDWRVSVGEEGFNLDELTPDATGSIKYRSKTYTLKFSFRGEDRDSEAERGAIELTIDETDLQLGELESDTKSARQREELRRQAVRQVAERLTKFINRVNPPAQ